jgi:hypothetical protein
VENFDYFCTVFRKRHGHMTLIPQSNFHTQEKEQITNIQWSVRYKRRLPLRIFEAVEGLTEVRLRFALSLYPKDSCRLPFREKLN